MAENFNMSSFPQPYWQMPPWMLPYPPIWTTTRGPGQPQPLSPADFGIGNIPGMQTQGQQPNVPGVQPNVPGVQPNVPGFPPNVPGFPPNVPGFQPGMMSVQPQTGGMLSPADQMALRSVLAVLREGRALIASGQFVGMNAHRVIAAYAYLAGFLEARGLLEVGTFLRTIPMPTPASGSPTGTEHIDRLLTSLDALTSSTDTRVLPLAPILIGVASGYAASALWDATKWAYGKVTS